MHTSLGATYRVSVTTITDRAEFEQAAPSLDLSGEGTSPLELIRQTWRSRKLLLILAKKDFHVRYRRASLGILWALALPILQAAVMAIVFSRVAHIRNAPHTNYTMFVIAGMAPWAYFSLALPAGSTSVVDGSGLAAKVYFPRAILPLTQLVTALYGYAVTLAIVLVLCPLLHVSLGPPALMVVPGTVLLVALTSGFVLVISALHVYFRDLRYFVSALMMVWLYLTPVVYPPIDVHGPLRHLIQINPMTGVVDLFHAATVGGVGPMTIPLVVSTAWAVCLLLTGTLLHSRFNRVFSDLL